MLASSYPRFPGDGTAPFVRSIAEHVAGLGNDVVVVAPYDVAVSPHASSPDKGLRVERFRYVWPDRFHVMGHARSLHADVRIRPLSYLLLPLFLLASVAALWRETARHKTDIIHVHWVLPNGPAAALVAALRRIPFVVSLHGSDMYVAGRNPAFGAVARFVFRRAAGVTACSPELRDAALALGAPAGTLLLPWGADPAVFSPARRSPEVRTAWGASPSQVMVAALGRLVHKKGFDVLLDAWAALAPRHPEARLVLGGDGPLRPELTERVQRLGLGASVDLVGQVPWDRVPDLLAAVDIFVLPSVRDASGNLDGLPTVLLEAMSSGAAVVASEIAGVGLVVRDGETGLLVPAGSAEALAAALEGLIGDSARRLALGQAARRAVETEFNWTATARRLVGLYQRALAGEAR